MSRTVSSRPMSSRDRNSAAVSRLISRNRSAPSPPPWTNPDARQSDGTLPFELHICHQWQLAQEMHALPTSALENGHTNFHADRSCLAMRQGVARHAVSISQNARKCLQNDALFPPETSPARAAAIVRYERTLPRRRAAAHLSQRTAAQTDTRVSVPNGFTADRMAARAGGRWVLQNAHRQELLRGEPVMTRVMRGEFYAGRGTHKQGVNYIHENKQHIAVASAINQMQNNTHAGRGGDGRKV